jgi:hypothetical protein
LIVAERPTKQQAGAVVEEENEKLFARIDFISDTQAGSSLEASDINGC